MVKAIMNQKEVEIDEKDLVNKDVRHAFVVVGDQVHFLPIGEHTTTYEFCIANELCKDAAEYEKMIRGAYDEHGIYFFKGSGCAALQYTGYLREMTEQVYEQYIKVFGYHYADIAIWSGMIMGEVGELWRPRVLMAALKPTGQIISI